MKSKKKNTFLLWKKMIGEWPEFTGCIIDNKFNVLETFERTFGDNGEYTKDVEDVIKKYKADGPHLVWVEKDEMDFPTEVVDSIEAAKRFKEEKMTLERIEKFLTPEKGAELLALFQKPLPHE